MVEDMDNNLPLTIMVPILTREDIHMEIKEALAVDSVEIVVLPALLPYAAVAFAICWLETANVIILDSKLFHSFYKKVEENYC